MSYHLQEINRRIQADPKEFVDASDAAYAAKIERAARAIAENAHTCPIVLLSGPSGSGIQCVTRTICPWHVHLPSSKYTHNPGFGGGYPEGSLMMHKTTSDTPHELETSGRRSVTGIHLC